VQNLQILIVSAVRICKQCLQTVYASGAFIPQIRTGTCGAIPPQMKPPLVNYVYVNWHVFDQSDVRTVI